MGWGLFAIAVAWVIVTIIHEAAVDERHAKEMEFRDEHPIAPHE